MTAVIRRVLPGDEALFERIADDVFDHPVDVAVLSEFLAAPGHHLVVALADGEVVGQAAGMLHRHPDGRPVELYVDELGVAPSHRRQGIGRRLLDELFALGRELGCREAWVGTEPHNVPATTLYGSLGAEPEPFVMYVLDL
jgi:aminoglycoside 6'-N-acetyltransferase I